MCSIVHIFFHKLSDQQFETTDTANHFHVLKTAVGCVVTVKKVGRHQKEQLMNNTKNILVFVQSVVQLHLVQQQPLSLKGYCEPKKELIQEIVVILFVTSVISVNLEELRCSPRVQFHCWLSQPKPVVLQKNMCFFHLQACIFTLLLLLFLLTMLGCLSSKMILDHLFHLLCFQKKNAGNMDIKSFIITLYLNDLA